MLKEEIKMKNVSVPTLVFAVIAAVSITALGFTVTNVSATNCSCGDSCPAQTTGCGCGCSK